MNSPLNLSSGNLNIGGNLNLGANITLNANSVNLGPAAQLANGSPSQYMVTNGTGTVNVQHLSAARGAVSLPIRTANHYNPSPLPTPVLRIHFRPEFLRELPKRQAVR